MTSMICKFSDEDRVPRFDGASKRDADGDSLDVRDKGEQQHADVARGQPLASR
jgi:hypothetical protein